ncbi:cyanophycin synthetase [Saccharibacillus sp. O23]|nr:cyanophycin synthetase [Saccharibacillus sp. O23]
MKVNKIKYWTGPNLYSYKPTIWVELDIGELEYKPSHLIPGFVDKLLEVLPTLRTHTCSRGYEGGFVERLREGTWMGHILEHMAIEIQDLAGIAVRRGKTITGSMPGIYYVTFGFAEKESGRYAFESALEIAEAILAGRTDISAAPYVKTTSELYFRNKLGPSTESIYKAALARKIPVERVGPNSTLRLGTGIKQKSVQATITGQTSYLAVENSCDKEVTKQLLEEAGLPVPRGTVVACREELKEAAEELGFPLVIKPLNGRQGQAVLTGLQTFSDLAAAYDFAVTEFPQYTDFIVERYYAGSDYRFAVVGGSFVAASLRRPPSVVGDGVSSIRTLIERENLNPLRGAEHQKPMSGIPLEQAEAFLTKSSISLEDIPAAGTELLVMGSANLSTGASAEDVTDRVHPSYARAAVEAAGAIGLDVAGVDIITEDPSVPFDPSRAAVLEVNAAPGIRMHHFPSTGETRDVGGSIVDYLFASREEAAIPLIAVTGTNGKTTTARLVAHLLSRTGQKVGLTCSDGVWVGDERIDTGDCSGPGSARKVLARRDVEAAVLETARGGIMREGLAFEWCDIGIVTNVSEDHLGQDGIDTLEDLRKLKRVVPEVVLPEGVCVLNADDDGCTAMGSHTQGRVVYFSLREHNPVVQGTLDAKGEIWFLSGDGWIVYSSRGRARRFIKAADVPIAIRGLAKHNIANAMAALAAVRATGMSLASLREGLTTFLPSPEQNRGRFNVRHAAGRMLIADYGHNPAGISAIYETVESMAKTRLITVASAPGDRPDRAIAEMGAIIGRHSDLFVIKEDVNTRGRKPFETIELLRQSSALDETRTFAVPAEAEAYRRAWELSEPGDLILMFYDDYEHVESFMNGLPEEAEERLDRKAENWAAGEPGTGSESQIEPRIESEIEVESYSLTVYPRMNESTAQTGDKRHG